MITLSVLVIGIFSAFILYDLKRVRDGEETNYISATLGVYLSIYNVFQALLMLLGIGGGRDEYKQGTGTGAGRRGRRSYAEDAKGNQ
jgi:modulator of FtsH protease